MQLTNNFYLEEFTDSNYAARYSINNEAPPQVAQNLLLTAQGLEKVRSLLGNNAIAISSGYRSPELNRKIGGSIQSHHLLGFAADFTCHGFGSPYDVVKAIVNSDIEYDQVIYEGRWVHISFKPSYRKQALKASFNAKRKTSYSAFA